MANVAFQSPRESLDTYHSDQSKSKRTLFDAPLEVLTEMEPTDFQNIDIDNYVNTHQPRKRSVDLSTLRQSYENQKLKVQQAEDDFKESQSKALTFQPKVYQHLNNQTRGFNKSKALMELLKPERHPDTKTNLYQYQLMGDVFSSAPDFDRTSNVNVPDISPRFGRRSGVQNNGFTSDFLSHRGATPHNTNQNCGGDVMVESQKSIIRLPSNIRHSFGSRLCDELLSDKIKVDRTLEQQRARKRLTKPEEDVPTMLETPLNAYEDLGHNTRLNVFPGLSVNKNQVSATKTHFDDSVFLKREPDPDKYRIQRDELSTWAERNVIRERLKKAWDQSHQSTNKKD